MTQSSRGRPVNPDKQAEIKRRLIEAAASLISVKSYRSITIRELAMSAGVNSAMIRYYFEHKEGLFIALLDQMSNQHFAQMSSVKQSSDPIRQFILTLLKMLNKNSGMARMIHDEILQQDSSLKTAFLQRFPKRMAQFLPRLIQQQIDAGKMRKNLNPKYAAFSLVSLIIMPFLAEPIREEAWEITATDLAQPEWAEHLYQLFMFGSREEKSSE